MGLLIKVISLVSEFKFNLKNKFSDLDQNWRRLKRRVANEWRVCFLIFLQKICIGLAILCHKKAKDDACKHLKCIKLTGKCFKKAGLRIEDLPENMVNTVLYIIVLCCYPQLSWCRSLCVSEIFRVLLARAYTPGRFKQAGLVWGRGVEEKPDERQPQSLQVEINSVSLCPTFNVPDTIAQTKIIYRKRLYLLQQTACKQH